MDRCTCTHAHKHKHTHTPTTPRTHSHSHSALSDCPGEAPQRQWPEGELLAHKGSPISWLLLHHQMMKMRSFRRWRLLDHWNGNVSFHKTFPIEDNIKSWTRAWQPTPVFLPGEFHRQRDLAGYSPGGHKELEMIERLNTSPFNYERYSCVGCYLHSAVPSCSVSRTLQWYQSAPTPARLVLSANPLREAIFNVSSWKKKKKSSFTKSVSGCGKLKWSYS